MFALRRHAHTLSISKLYRAHCICIRQYIAIPLENPTQAFIIRIELISNCQLRIVFGEY